MWEDSQLLPWVMGRTEIRNTARCVGLGVYELEGLGGHGLEVSSRQSKAEVWAGDRFGHCGGRWWSLLQPPNLTSFL